MEDRGIARVERNSKFIGVSYLEIGKIFPCILGI